MLYSDIIELNPAQGKDTTKRIFVFALLKLNSILLMIVSNNR
jgi:hypothetical protein